MKEEHYKLLAQIAHKQLGHDNKLENGYSFEDCTDELCVTSKDYLTLTPQ